MKTNLILVGSIIIALVLIAAAAIFLKEEEQVSYPVSVVEYFDASCVHCKDFHPISKQLQTDFGEDIEYEYIQHPFLANESFQAAYALEAAREQGKYNEYLDLLFENYESRTDDDFVKFAKELELDVKKFNKDRNAEGIQKRIEDQLKANAEKKIEGTPTVFVNNKRVGSLSYDNIKQLIQEKIELAKKQNETGN